MIRLLLALSIISVFLNAGYDVNRKISRTNSELNSYSKDYKTVNKKMSETAHAILEQKREINKQEEYLKKLKSELSNKESSYKDDSAQLKKLQRYNKKLKEDQDNIEQELVFVISKSVSLSLILEEEYAVDSESLIEYEVLKKMLKISKDKVEKLNKQFFENSKKIKALNKHTKQLQASISDIDSKRKSLITTQKANKKALSKLEISKESYKKELKIILSKKEALKKTLDKLNIIKLDAIKEAKNKKDIDVAFDNKKIVSDKNLPKVKKHGSSYQAVKTKRYRGPKTIAPLDSYTITKKYGTYTDPVYGIKIFNESISLKPKQDNAKVKTVFNGKVIYADKTAVLDNIVIIEHANGLDTIYANLSQIAPNIRKGMKIKKGYTIGRVKDELVFEVTQKSFHINPIRLFE
jgi:murein DD-endopeptidase MepM/ murein hydrolase activator NlpD